MRKLIFLLLVVSLLVPSTVFADEEELITALQIQVDELKIQVNELSEKIDTLFALLTPSETEENVVMGTELKLGNGTYLVPDDLKYGIWSFIADTQDGECYISTFSVISTNSVGNKVDAQTSKQGYFTVDNLVKVVEVGSSDGAKCEIEFYKDL